MLLCHMSTMPSSAIMCNILAVGCCLSQHLCKQLQEPRLKSWGCSQHHRMTVAYLLTHFSGISPDILSDIMRKREGGGGGEQPSPDRWGIKKSIWENDNRLQLLDLRTPLQNEEIPTQEMFFTGTKWTVFYSQGVGIVLRENHAGFTVRSPYSLILIPILSIKPCRMSILTNQTKNETKMK